MQRERTRRQILIQLEDSDWRPKQWQTWAKRKTKSAWEVQHSRPMHTLLHSVRNRTSSTCVTVLEEQLHVTISTFCIKHR